MKSCGWIIVGWGLLLAAGYGAESDGLDPIRDIYLTCRHPGGPMSDDDLLGYAKSHGFSDAEMAAQLVALAQTGLNGEASAEQRRFGGCAIYSLALFGGQAEKEFVRKTMRESEDPDIRSIAFHTGLRLAPEEWEEWLREVMADRRSGTLERFLAYEESFLVGMNGDEKTRQRVIEVFGELCDDESLDVDRDALRRWIGELEKMP